MPYQVIDVGGSSIKGALLERAGEGQWGLLDGPWVFEEPDWEHFERWVVEVMPLRDGVDSLGVSSAGFLDIQSGVVKLLPVAGWTDRPLRDKLQRAYGVPVHLLNDGEAHLCAHLDVYPNPQITIAFGTALGFGWANAAGEIVRPRPDRNFDIGEWRIPTRAENTAVWWALGEEGFQDLLDVEGEVGALRHWGYRAGQFLVSIASVFQPRAMILTGGKIDSNWADVERSLRAAITRAKPEWLETPLIVPSPYGRESALFGMAKYVASLEGGKALRASS